MCYMECIVLRYRSVLSMIRPQEEYSLSRELLSSYHYVYPFYLTENTQRITKQTVEKKTKTKSDHWSRVQKVLHGRRPLLHGLRCRLPPGLQFALPLLLGILREESEQFACSTANAGPR